MKIRLVVSLAAVLLGISPSFAGVSEGENELAALYDSLFSSVPEDVRGKRITVVPFTENAGQGSGIGENLAEFMVVRIQQQGFFTLVDRGEFQRVVSEIELSQTGLVEENASIQVGKMLASQYLLTGSIATLFGKYRVTAKIINTETTKIVKSASVSLRIADLENFSQELLGQTGKVSSAVFRSIIPGWGQFYTNHPIRGAISLTACLGALGATGYYICERNKWEEKVDERREMKDSKKIDELSEEEITRFDEKTKKIYSDYSESYDRVILMGIITGTLWALNLTDAAIAGVQSRKKFKLYFSSDLNGDNLETGIAVRF